MSTGSPASVVVAAGDEVDVDATRVVVTAGADVVVLSPGTVLEVVSEAPEPPHPATTRPSTAIVNRTLICPPW
jgi:hypothetical protein